MTNNRKLLDDCFLHDKDRIKHAEVLSMIATNVSIVVEDEIVTLDEAAGRVCAEDLAAPRNVPLTDNSAVDGYAFSHQDYAQNHGKFKLGALIAAGQIHEVNLNAGECARIFTGATMPTNAETVAMQEDCTTSVDGMIQVPPGLKKGANCRLSGEDLSAGDLLIERGDFITPARIAALASIGQSHIKVRKKLRVAIISTGNEIIAPGQEITAGQVYDANRPMLKALLTSALIEITDIGIVSDDEATLVRTLKKASGSHDLVLTSGGASRGDEDHMLNALDTLGKRHLWQIAIKPGRPMMFGQIGNCVVIGLPGNPVAAFVCSLLYVTQVAYRLTGSKPQSPYGMMVPAGFEITKKKTDRREFLRGWLQTDSNGKTTAVKFGRDGSGLISGLREATGLIEIPEEVDHVSTDDLVHFIPLSSFKPR